jgi:hypothetical protein
MPDQPDPDDSSLPPEPPKSGRKQPGGQPAVTPHDSVFRQVFGVPANAASALRAVLPPPLTARLDLGRLAPVPGSFVDESLRWRHSDLLFTAPLEGRDAFVYVLMEHQSRTDPLMPYRMLAYVTRIWDKYVRDHPGARQLPAVIPLVVHNGRSRWSGPVQVAGLIDLPPAARQQLRALLPHFEVLLDDLAALDAPQLCDRQLTPAALITLLLLKTAPGSRQIRAQLRPWSAQLRALLDSPGGDKTFIALLTYIESVTETPDSELRDLAASLGPDAEEAYMTTAEMLRAEGEARRAADDTILVLESRGLHPTPAQREKIQACQDTATLNARFKRSLTAAAVGDIFQGEEDN